MSQRNGAVTFQGNSLTLVGNEIEVGAKAPDFTVLANDMSDATIADYVGKILIIASVPSLDTPVCDMETRRFNAEATALGDDVKIITLSMDLPFAQARWCGAAGVQAVQTLSDHRDASFGEAYGVLIKELRLLSRAVFIVGKDGVVRYVQYVAEITQEPDYQAVFEAVKGLVR